jgi:Q family heterogeneous nuclear ribonucleoprotein R
MSSSILYLDQEDMTRRLLALQDRTGYDIVQKHGQRIYGGPPPGWSGPQPDKGTEVYCFRIPRDCFEDELVPVFSSVGRIYELRLMIEFSGTNRSYCYVRYTTQEEAREAIKKLNNHYIRPGYSLAVTRSVDNRKLSIKTSPAIDKETEEQVIVELRAVVEGVDRVRFQPRGWVEVEFNTHRLAALARRQLVPGNVILFNEVVVKQVDWADPEVGKAGQDTQGKVLSVRNVSYSTSDHMVGDMFNKLSGGQVTNLLRDRNMVLVTFVSQDGAMLAMEKSRGMELEGSKLEVSWWSQRRLDRGSYSSQPRSQVHHIGHDQVMACQGQYMQDYMMDREMARLAQRNMMASQFSQPPPGYSLAEALSGLSLARQPTQSPGQLLPPIGHLPHHQPQYPAHQVPPQFPPPSGYYP